MVLKEPGHFQPFLSILRGNDPGFDIWDDFTDTRAAGAVDGTPATPGPGTREVYQDTGNNLTIGSDVMNLAGAAGASDPRVYFTPAQTRANGLMLIAQLNQAAQVGGLTQLGFTADGESTQVTKTGFLIDTDELFKIHVNGAAGISELAMAASTDYLVAVVLMASGAYWFIKGGIYTEWRLVWWSAGDATATLYPVIYQSTARDLDVGFLRVPTQRFLPIPWLSDDFGNLPTVQDVSARAITATPNKVGFRGINGGTWHGAGYLDVDLTVVDDLLDPEECTIIQRVKFNSWVTTTSGYTFCHYVNANGSIRITKATDDNKVEFLVYGSGGIEGVIFTGKSDTDFVTLAMAISASENEIRASYDGTPGTADVYPTSYPTPTNRILIGDFSKTYDRPFNGFISDTILGINGVVLSDSDMSAITTLLDAGTLDADTLDLYFGAGNWVWFQHDQQYQPDGAGHALANGPGIRKYIGNGYHLSNQLKNTVIGSGQLFTNGDFADWTGDDPDRWTISGETAPDPEVTERANNQGHADGPAGTGAANFYTSGGVLTMYQNVLTASKWYKFVIEISKNTTGTVRLFVGNEFEIIATGATGFVSIIHRATGTAASVQRQSATDITMDSASVEEITMEQMVQLAPFPDPDVMADCVLAEVSRGNPIGLALCVDDPENIQNGVFVYYHDNVYGGVTLGAGDDLVIDKCVNGTWSQVGRVAITHGATKILRVTKDVNTFNIYYDGAKVDAQTIADASVVNNVWHGALITEGAIEDLVIHARSDWGVLDRFARE